MLSSCSILEYIARSHHRTDYSEGVSMSRIRTICSSRGAIAFFVLVALVCGYLTVKPLIPTTVPPQADSVVEPSVPSPSITPSAVPDPRLTTTSTPSPTASPVNELINPKGKPTKMAIFNGKDQLVGMEVEKNGTPDRDDFQSQCGMTTWYSAQGWPTPGAESLQRSLITGHMQCRGATYSINDLKMSPKGAILKVTFDKGCVVLARATMAATNIAKPQLNERSRLYNKELARIIRVSTCDDEAKKDAQGHSTKNYYQMFEVVSVTCPS